MKKTNSIFLFILLIVAHKAYGELEIPYPYTYQFTEKSSYNNLCYPDNLANITGPNAEACKKINELFLKSYYQAYAANYQTRDLTNPPQNPFLKIEYEIRSKHNNKIEQMKNAIHPHFPMIGDLEQLKTLEEATYALAEFMSDSLDIKKLSHEIEAGFNKARERGIQDQKNIAETNLKEKKKRERTGKSARWDYCSRKSSYKNLCYPDTFYHITCDSAPHCNTIENIFSNNYKNKSSTNPEELKNLAVATSYLVGRYANYSDRLELFYEIKEGFNLSKQQKNDEQKYVEMEVSCYDKPNLKTTSVNQKQKNKIDIKNTCFKNQFTYVNDQLICKKKKEK